MGTNYFYVLVCCDNSLYAGYTNNLDVRIKKHNSGKGAKYTRARKPVQLIYYEEFEDKTLALKKEVSFKKLNRNQKLLYLQKRGVELCGLNQVLRE
ncbi:MAG: endonuclease [Bacillales bacterium]|jgi:putative endonuclease|nr:endonuclease [Bacillales bacterium]